MPPTIFGGIVEIMKIKFSYAELLLVCSTVLFVTGNQVLGIIFGSLSLFGLFFRLGMNLQEREKEKEEKDELIKGVSQFTKKLFSQYSLQAADDDEIVTPKKNKNYH